MIRTPARIASSILAALTVSACAGAGGHGPQPITPTERYPLKAEAHPEEIAFRPHAEGLSANQNDALARFAKAWADQDGGPIMVGTPDNGGEVANRTGFAVKARLVALGVRDDDVRVEPYKADAEGAPVRIAYERYVAKVPHCNRSWSDLTANYQNNGEKNFGCALSANMAAQIANPRDIAGPAAMTPSDAARRQAVMEKYRSGQPTGAIIEDKSAGKVAAVQD
jgi:pilus assembly protein CpaD